MVERIATSNGETLEGSNQADLLEAVGFSDNILLGLAGDDELIAGTNGLLRGGDDDDILDATPGNGGNTLEGEAGNDDLFGGDVIDNPDTLNGGEGDDRLFGGLAGNTLSGGEGSDQFWIAQAELPTAPIRVTDFAQGVDVIGIGGLTDIAEDFEDLEIEQADGNTFISVDGETNLAILEGFTDQLTQDDFVFTTQVTPPPDVPLVTLAIEPTEGSEEEQTVFTLAVTASEAVTGEQTVGLALSGDADADDFVEPIPETIAIADGETSATVELTVNDDNLVEGDETATFTLSNPSDGIELGSPEQVSVTIIDNDDPTPFGDRVFRFFNPETGGHLYTADVGERELITNQLPQFELEGVGFLAAQADDPNGTEVFRFFNTQEEQYFYTASQEEREFVEENLPNFVFEGVAFSAYEEELPETTPVFRFFDAEGSGHFYTASTEERDFLLENVPDFELEGVAFYANDISEGLLT